MVGHILFFHCIRVDLACKLAIDSVKCVTIVDGNRKEIDIKRYAKVEKVCCCKLILILFDN